MDFDVIIIGTGIAGITLAKHFPSDLKVALVDKGDYGYNQKINTNDYGSSKNLGNFPVKNYSVNFSSIKSLGGNSNIWSGWCMPMSKNETKDWPIVYSEISNYYKKTEDFLLLKNFDDLKKTKSDFEDYENKDWRIDQWQFVKQNHFNEILKKIKKNIIIFSKSELQKISYDAQNVNYVSILKDKKIIHLKSKFFILAQGGLESTKTLMKTKFYSNRELGNENGHLGKFYMEHPHLTLGYFLNNKKSLNKNIFKKKNNLRHGFFLREPYSINKYFNASIAFNDDNLLSLNESLKLQYLIRLKKIPKNYFNLKSSLFFLPMLIKGSYSYIFDKLMSKKFIYGRFEQKPSVHSYISLSVSGRIDMNWSLEEQDILNIINISKNIQKFISNKISHKVYIYKDVENFNDWMKNNRSKILGIGHHMGTTMMSENKNFGVVNKDLKLHSLDNLFICSSSVFPTGGIAHPTFTLCALSIRLAEHLLMRLKERN